MSFRIAFATFGLALCSILPAMAQADPVQGNREYIGTSQGSPYPLPSDPPDKATEGSRYTGLILGSQHIGSETLNDFNPGITIGYRWPASGSASESGMEWHVEAGVFYNSYKEISPILLAGLSAPVARIAGGDLRIGLSIGTAYYATLAPRLEHDHGIPNLNGFIPMVAATTSWRKNEWEYRITTVPAGSDTLAIFNFSIAYRP